MSETSTDIPEIIPGLALSDDQLTRIRVLQGCANIAEDAWLAKKAADVAAAAAEDAWLAALESLTSASLAAVLNEEEYREIPVPPHAVAGDLDQLAPEPIGGGPVRSRSGEGQRSGQASTRDRRAERVMEAMGRLGDDVVAVAAELGMKRNAVTMVAKHARKRQAVEA